MAQNIVSDEADRLARELAAVTGEDLADAVTIALAERLARCKGAQGQARRAALRALRDQVSRLPVRFAPLELAQG